MTTLRPEPNELLQRQINELLPEGQRVIVHERTLPDNSVLYCLIFQYGSRRHVVEESQPFTAADIPMIIDAVQRWVAGSGRSRGPRWTEDPMEADGMLQ